MMVILQKKFHRLVFPDARYQRCTVHFYRNIFSVTPRNKMKAVAMMLKAIHAQESKEAAREKALHIAKLNGRLCGAKRPHSVSEQPNFYQSLQSNPYNDSSHPSGGE